MTTDANAWPELPLEPWQDTYETVHLWTQIVGKIRLAKTPWFNQSWHVPLYVTVRGFTTSLIAHEGRSFEIEFDFLDHALHVTASDSTRRSFALEPMSVAAFYNKVMHALEELGMEVKIYTKPVEIPDPIIDFREDEQHASYDAVAIERFWRALLHIHRVFTIFRSRYAGKVSPVHFFWGAFDLAVTRFSGRTAPKHPGGVPNCADWVMEEAYSHEVSSAGFWPGAGLGEASFYSYAYPAHDDFKKAIVQPDAAYYLEAMGEFVLPYEAVRTAKDPDVTLLTFLQSTYDAAADLGKWDRKALEGSSPKI